MGIALFQNKQSFGHKALLLVTLFLSSVSAYATLDMDQISSTSGLASADNFASSQIFPDAEYYNTMALADVNLSSDTISEIDAGFEFSRPEARALVTGFRVSVFGNIQDAVHSDLYLQYGTLATVDVGTGDVAVSDILGTSLRNTPTRFQLTNLKLNVGVGKRWLGVSPILLAYPNFDQAYILINKTPDLVGAGSNNDVAVNPGGGFPLNGTERIDTHDSNAAYAVTTVPEPASLTALSCGLLALAKRRRR